jgi:hypothetical protein
MDTVPVAVAVVAPGEIVSAYCKVCKAVVEHGIVTVKAKKPLRVQCRTCEDAHPFRASKPAPRKKAASKTKALSAEDNYESLMLGRDSSQAEKYAFSHEFADRDLVDHSTFGLGLVTRVLADQKIEVLFSGGPRLLVHNR